VAANGITKRRLIHYYWLVISLNVSGWRHRVTKTQRNGFRGE